jgi:hypothetical protein
VNVSRYDLNYVVSDLNLVNSQVRTDYEYEGNTCVAITVENHEDALRLFYRLGRVSTHHVSDDELLRNLLVEELDDGPVIVFPNVHVTDSATSVSASYGF